ncbi:MAG: EamA family transporter [Solirubrobacterales bacterium]|nr:EamA family transporter [Solirubrobacterales bacterium]
MSSLVIGTVILLALGDSLPTGAPLWYALAAGVCGGFGLIALYTALSIGIMSIAAPISALAAAVPFLWGMMRGDSPRAIQLVGACVALIGALLAAREPSHSHVSREKFQRSVGLALISAVLLGTGLVFLGYAAPGGAMPVLVADRIATSAITVPLAIMLGKMPRRGGGPVWPLIAVGLFDTSANAFYIAAFQQGGMMALVGVLASLYPVTTVVLARLTLKESMERHQAIGVGVALAGIALIAV